MTMDKKTKGALVGIAGLIGAVLYRLRGGPSWGPKLPRPLDQILFSLVPCIVLPALYAFAHRPFLALESWPWIAGWLVAALWAVAWECSGHGKYMDLGTTVKESDEERIGVLISWLHGKVPEYWYDALGLALTGFVVTLGPGVYVAVAGDVLAGILLALTGLLKAPAYMLGFAISKAKGTEIGEWVSGGLRWAAAAAIGLFLWV